jgi:hypothetical protein
MLNLNTTVDAKIRRKANVGTLRGGDGLAGLALDLWPFRQGDQLRRVLRVTEALPRSRRRQTVATGPTWTADITDDHRPIESSLALNDQSEISRILRNHRIHAIRRSTSADDLGGGLREVGAALGPKPQADPKSRRPTRASLFTPKRPRGVLC